MMNQAPAPVRGGLPRLDSLSHLRDFLERCGYTAEDTRVTAELFSLPPHQGVLLDGAHMIALAGEPDDPTLNVFYVPRADLNKDVRARIRKVLETRARDGLIFCTQDWQKLTLYLLLQQDEENELPAWTMHVHALRPNDLQALQLLDIHHADMFELDRHLRRAFKRAERETLYNNQGFFSNYYLIERLERDHPEWQALVSQMGPLRETIQATRPAPGQTLDAAATQQRIVRPILDALGWKADAVPQANRYDLALKVGGRRWAICNVVAAGESLELPAGAQSDSSPDLRMIAALTQDTDPQMLWGVLTNGTTWRLFGKPATSASGVYYEIDLPDLLAIGELHDLRFFAAFFGAAGLAPTAPQQPALTTRIYLDGQSSARKVGEDLKAAIFDQVFVDLATALGEAMRRRGEDADSDTALHLLYRATLILLYRLLFLLYAESRRLLPVHDLDYYPRSLTNLLKHLSLQRSGLLLTGDERPMAPDSPWVWQWLQALFAAIDAGQPGWGVPRYNGGLFSTTASDAHALLARLDNVGADYLTLGLDGLARDTEARRATHTNEALRLIDYMALDVRRLGSIYEGLLEFQLRRASGTLISRDGQWYAPAREEKVKDNAKRVERGQLYLEHTRSERKASGSYYTPDYIVRYIVEHAVGPVFAERAHRFADAMTTLRTKRTSLRRASSSATVQVLREEVENLEHKAYETLLDLKILDPAMGSGHFLVSTVDYLSDQMITVLEDYDDNPIYPKLRTIRESIKTSMHEQGLDARFIRDDQLTNRSLLRRMVMKRCVYGVDLNDLAVELARLSLWLHSFTVGAPLSFLDHHLKWGNSLIGTRVTEVEQELQADLFGGPFAGLLAATTQMTELVQIADATYAELERSEGLYHDFETAVAPYKAMLDIWVSQHFGNRYAKEFLTLFQGDTVQAVQGEMTVNKNYQGAIEQGHTLAADKRFFHWDLEFPEVFVDLQRKHWKEEEEAGFDAVIGNPPYINANELNKILGEYDKDYWRKVFIGAKGAYDIYVLFIEKTLKLISVSRLVGLITPNKYLAAPYGLALRDYIIQNHTFCVLGDFSRVQVFEDPAVYPIISVFERGRRATEYQVSVKQFLPNQVVTVEQSSGFLQELPDHVWSFLVSEGITSVQRIAIISEQLCEICQVNASSTAAEADSYSAYISEDPAPLVNASWKVVNTGIIDRFHTLWGYDKLTHQHNQYYYPVISQKAPVISTNRRLQYSRPKIIFAKMALVVEGFIDLEGLYASMNTNFALHNNGQYNLLCVGTLCNSRLMSWLYTQYFGTLRMSGGYYQFQAPQLRILPIRRIHFTTPQDERTRRVKELSAQADAMTAPAAPLDVLRDVGPFRASALGQALAALLPTDDDGLFLAFAEGASGAEEHSDVVHDLLAHLAQRMIDLNKQKQQEMQRYLGGLEQRLDIAHKDKTGIDALSGKTTLQNYLGDYQKGEEAQPWEAVLAVLSKNKGKFGVGKQVLEAPQVGRLRADYEDSLAKLAPIKAQLARTDALIDQVVYLLYGLSADEVAVVEGAG